MSMNTFPWDGAKLPYFDHLYNKTRYNSRRVEVPIIRHHAEKMALERGPISILEIGNVLSHYQAINWPVVDRYEEGCINIGVKVYEPRELVDLVISISTIEHISGEPNDVLGKIRTFLAPNGLAVITVPPRFNKHLDRHLHRGTLAADFTCSMRHLGDGDWFPCSTRDALNQSPRGCFGQWHAGMVCIYLYAKGGLTA